MGRQRLAFRSAFLPSIGIALVALILGIGLGVGITVLRYGGGVNWAAMSTRLVWVAVGLFVVVLAAVVLFRVFMSEDGLRCYTFWGNYRTLPWQEIDFIRPVNLLVVRYLRVGSSESGYTVWVPLFLTDMPGFRAAVEELAGEGHPLVRALS